MFPSTVVKKVAAVALVAAVLASLLFLVHFYKEKADTSTERLQGVTTELTETRDAYDRYVNEQSLIRDILAAGAAAKQASKEKTDDAITKHKASGTRVIVSDADADLLYQRSREVREGAAGSLQ
ncbi:hypothetical protein [Cronobacter phage GY3]|uniref:Uncharacterized protein n=1 Tax=Cronobacter phage GY3 TaxID=3075035 RepID=A0AA48R2R2_9CAUD|nr:hypothetical protein [Cronobacter phage GY3]